MNNAPYFLQVSDKKAINTTHIQMVHFLENSVEFTLLSSGGHESRQFLVGKELEAFMHWWNNRALVYKYHKREEDDG